MKRWSYATSNLHDEYRMKDLLAQGYEPFAVTQGWFFMVVHFKREEIVK